MTPTEEVLNRYQRNEKIVDKLNRTITLRVLKPSQNMAVLRMVDSDRDSVVMSFMVAASVSQIDEGAYTFPKTLKDAEHILDKLDREGMAAATNAYIKLHGLDLKKDDDEEAAAA